MAGTIRLALVGCGGIARAHLEGYGKVHEQEPDLFRFVAFCDEDASRAEAFAQKVEEVAGYRPRVYTDHREMLAQEELDGVDVCTPHHLHHVVAEDCLEAGAYVMVEKPIGLTVAATKRIMEAARRAGKWVATAENVRRGPSQRAARWAIQERGLLGEMRFFFAQYAGWRAHKVGPWHWRADLDLSGGGLLYDSGAHFCDTVRFLFGDVESVYARVHRFEQHPLKKGEEWVEDEREDFFQVLLNFASGLWGTWSWTHSAPGHEARMVVYYGSEGALVDYGDVFHGPFGNAEWKLKDGTVIPMAQVIEDYHRAIGPQEKERLFPYGWTNGIWLEVYDFLRAIRDGRLPEVPVEEGLKAKAIALAAYESSALGEVVRVEDVLEGKVAVYQRRMNARWGLE